MSAETARFTKDAGRRAAALPGRKRHRAEEALRRHRRQPLEAQLAQVGSWEWDLATDRVSWSAGRVVRVVGTNQDITVDREGPEVILVVRADGRGFDPAHTQAVADTRGFGLTCTRERVQAIGGQVTPCSAPGAGTRIQAQTAARTPS